MSDRHSLKEPRPAAPLPDKLARPCIDVHAHLELVSETAPDSPEVRKILDDARDVGVDRVVQVGYSAEQSRWGVKCA
jgi:TatD DNase family protein